MVNGKTEAPTDFLERNLPLVEDKLDLSATNRLLRGILSELRKNVPKQRCVIYIQGGVIANNVVVVTAISPPAEIKFLNAGNPVKSLHTIIINTSDAIARVNINDPNMGVGHGIPLAIGAVFTLPDVEVQSLSIGSASVNNIPINTPPLVAANGSIWVYGWTLPEYANITE